MKSVEGNSRPASDRVRDLLVGVEVARVGQRQLARGSPRRVSGPSSESSPRNATSSSRSIACDWKSGNSSRHGPHHDAHLLTTTGKPSSSASRASKPSSPSSRISFACSRSADQLGRRAGERGGRLVDAQLGRRIARIVLVPTSRSRRPRRRAINAHVKMPIAARELIRRFRVVLLRWSRRDRGGTGQAEGKAAPTASTSLHRSSPRAVRPGGHLTESLSMANTTDVAARAARTPTEADLERAEKFTREPILLEGEKLGGPRAGQRAHARAPGRGGGARCRRRGPVDRLAPRVLARARARALPRRWSRRRSSTEPSSTSTRSMRSPARSPR